MIRNANLMPFKKYVEAKGISYSEDTIKINGTFKENPSGSITKGDIFDAHKLGKLTLKEIYKVYLDWFNYTRTENEEEREFVDVKIIEGEEK